MKNTYILLSLLLLLMGTSCVVTEDDEATPGVEEEMEPSSLSIGLLFHAPFSGNADDVSTNRLSSTITGATITSDRNGKMNEAYRFDGENDYINFGQANHLGLGGAQPYTMTAWVKPENTDHDSRITIVSKFDGGVSAGWYLAVNGENKAQAYRNVSPWATYGEGVFPRNQYVHLASVFDGANLSLYVNGRLDATRPFRTHPNDTRTETLVGATFNRGTPNSFFKGTIDDVRIYNRVLTEDELAWLADN